MIEEFISTNLGPICGIILLSIFIYWNSEIEKRTKYYFYSAIILTLLEIVFHTFSSFIEEENYSLGLKYFLKIIAQLIKVAEYYCLFVITSIKQSKRKNFLIATFSIIITLSIYIPAPFLKWPFYYEGNKLIETSLFLYTTAFISFIYILAILINSLIYKRTVNKTLIIIVVCIFMAFASVIDALYKKYDIGHIIFVLSLIFYYIYIQQNRTNFEMQKIEGLAEHDSLTNLLNRRGFERVIKVPYLDNISLTLVFIDIDDFKTINDTRGHEEADKELINVSKELKKEFDSNDIFVRFGGDEFAVLMMNVNEELAKVILPGKIERINERLNKERGISVSAGASSNLKGYVEQLYRNADAALYNTKKNGKSGFTFYEENMKDIFIKYEYGTIKDEEK